MFISTWQIERYRKSGDDKLVLSLSVQVSQSVTDARLIIICDSKYSHFDKSGLRLLSPIHVHHVFASKGIFPDF